MSPTRPLPEALQAALDAASPWVDTRALAAAWADREGPPVHAVVVGRQGVGKSTLVNGLLGPEVAATGLGGVTQAQVAHTGDDLVLVDTPGLEDPLAAADALEARLPTLDALVWVVDGLQPLTRIEREALDDGVPEGLACVVAVSRLDLVDADEHAAILERVRVGTLGRRPAWVGAVDPRDPPGALRVALAVDWTRSPRRLTRLDARLADVQAALGHLPDPPEVQAVVEAAAGRWRQAVHDAHDGVVARVREGGALFRDEALAALHRPVVEAAEALAAALAADPGLPWTWRPTPPSELDLRGQLQDLVSGTAGVLRALREGAAAWASDGALDLLDLLDTPAGRALAARRRALAEARERVAEAREALAATGLVRG